MTRQTSGSHGLAAEQLLAQSRQPEIDFESRVLFLVASITEALLSVSGQLGEIISWASIEDPENPAMPDAGPLVTCGAVHPFHPELVCTENPDHHLADLPHGSVPPGLGDKIKIHWPLASETPIGDSVAAAQYLAAPAGASDDGRGDPAWEIR